MSSDPSVRPDGQPAPVPKPPPRPPAEIERDIEAERQGLVDAVTALKGGVNDTRAKVLSPRVLGIAASVFGTLIVLRRRRKRRRRARG